MNQQARKLAELVAGGASPRRFAVPSVVLASGQGGVGKTSLAVALAVALARQGQRVLLADFDPGLADVSVVLGIEPPVTSTDLLQGSRSLLEVLVPGPIGIDVLPAVCGAAELAAAGAAERGRLIAALSAVRGRADVIVVDAGSGAAPNVLDFVAAADLALLVTSPVPSAYTDAYALVKRLSQRDGAAVDRMRLLVNRTRGQDEGRRIARALREVARRFLGSELRSFGDVPEDPAVEQASRQQRAFSLSAPVGPAALAARSLATSVAATLGLPAPAKVLA